ncbi:Txe/YoeB family addiction module toxin [Sphingomonas sp.]|uniref:Txe/YoeB family addiction module toxin n=1 Tax=Sphingomonas sp. TaxID=28214 RepID=UPI00286BB91D|nr:Txe/YoeB family addiction module toxin [Sphingomonas sp.]
MRLTFTADGWEDYLFWQSDNPKLLARINELLRDAMRSPFKGIGKPEPLRDDWSGWWSRRIDSEHRLVYRVTEKAGAQQLAVARCRFQHSR